MTTLCRWCGIRPAVQHHHLVMRSKARRLKHFEPNLIGLCLICHDAAHRKKTFIDGQSCRNCPKFLTCDAGQATYAPPQDAPPLPL